jgi:hypothetical protein
MTGVVVLKRRPVGRRDAAARESAMDAVCAPVRGAGDAKKRQAMARRVVRYAAITLAAQIGVKAAALHLASLAGRMFDEADEG